MNHEEMNLTAEELDLYFKNEKEIEMYDEAIHAMKKLVDNEMFPKDYGAEVLVALYNRCRQKERIRESLQSK